MSRYFFHLSDGKEARRGHKPEGLELPGTAAARQEALMLARARAHWNGWFVQIVDAHGRTLDTLAIADAPEAS